MKTTTTTLMLALLGVALLSPTSSATTVDDAKCLVVLYVGGTTPCDHADEEKRCQGTLVMFVLTDDTCQKEEETGCSGNATVFILSNDNCHGGTGQDGCEADVVVADPTTSGNCVGGAGKLIFDFLDGNFPTPPEVPQVPQVPVPDGPAHPALELRLD